MSFKVSVYHEIHIWLKMLSLGIPLFRSLLTSNLGSPPYCQCKILLIVLFFIFAAFFAFHFVGTLRKCLFSANQQRTWTFEKAVITRIFVTNIFCNGFVILLPIVLLSLQTGEGTDYIDMTLKCKNAHLNCFCKFIAWQPFKR